VGRSADSAKVTLESVPLTPDLVYVPAKPRSRPGQVVKQEPRGGHLSANDEVRLFVSLAADGLVPNLVGSSLPAARERTRKLRLAVRIRFTSDGPSGTVVRQSLEPGVAARPGLPITLLVGDGSTS
jgi:beta-lactam-binding protein with PASTA domain